MIEARIQAAWYASDEPRQFDPGDGSRVRPTLAWDEEVLEGQADGEAVQLKLDGVGMLAVDPRELLEALVILGHQHSGKRAATVDSLQDQLATGET